MVITILHIEGRRKPLDAKFSHGLAIKQRQTFEFDMVLWWLCVVELFKGYALAEMWIFWDGGMRFFKYLKHLFII